MMETRYGPVKLKVPKGFPVLLQRFAREVIREQPDDIVAFGATFFETLVVERKVTGEDPLETDPFDKPGFHAPPAQPLRPISSKIRQKEIEREKAAIKIQAGYRGFQVRKASVTLRRQQEEQNREEAAIKIQAHYRGFQTRKSISQPAKVESTEEGNDAFEQVGEEDEFTKQDELNLDAEPSEEKPPTPIRTAEEISKDSGDEKEIASDEKNDSEHPETNDLKEQEAAAVKIQAVFRGHKSRKQQQEKEDQKKAPKTYSKDEEEAAVKIQATFRGHKSRMQLQEKKDQKKAPKTYSRDEEEAAVKIQASFRGYTSRKQLQEKNTVRNADKPENEVNMTIQDKGYDDYSHQQREEMAAQNRIEQSDPDEESADIEDLREENTRELQDENVASATSQKDDDPVVQDEAAKGYEAGKDESEKHDVTDENVALSQEEKLTADDLSENNSGESPTEQNESEKYTYGNEAVESSQEGLSAGDPKDDNVEESLRQEIRDGTPAPEEAEDESNEQGQDKIELSAGGDPIVDTMDEVGQDEEPRDVAEKDEVEEQAENKETTELSEKNDQSVHGASDDIVKGADRVHTDEDGGDLSESTNKETTGVDNSTPEVQDAASTLSPRDA